MRRFVIAGMVLALGTAQCFAQEDGARPQDRNRSGERSGDGEGRPGGFRGFNPVFDAIDADGDGTLSAQEIQNAAAALKSLDRDGDGKISREEARPQGRGFGGRGFGDRGQGGGTPGGGPGNVESFVARMLERDANNDGKLDREELGERGARLLETGDANGDGALDKEELEKAYQEMMSRFRNRDGEGAGRGRGGRGPGSGGPRPQRPRSSDSN